MMDGRTVNTVGHQANFNVDRCGYCGRLFYSSTSTSLTTLAQLSYINSKGYHGERNCKIYHFKLFYHEASQKKFISLSCRNSIKRRLHRLAENLIF